ncbi:hypothetical protein [Flexithrix dorotheae]|uniref:hypothetical protein n=1 Tax=Flexithrix dorotheae TaxID=70993 RepID=UPI00146DBE0B|nr:hypothetical protein [Flexithrix dorotheae]
MLKIIFFLSTTLFCTSQLFSQSTSSVFASNKDINSSGYKADFRYAQKNLFYFQDLEIIEKILVAVKAGKIQVFKSDGLEEKNTSETFLKAVAKTLEDIQHFKTKYSGENSVSWINYDESFFLQENENDGNLEGTANDQHFPDVFSLELRNEFVFDQFHEIKSTEIKAITLILPAEYNAAGETVKLGAFSYEELKENVFLLNNSALLPGIELRPEGMEIVEFGELKVYTAQSFKSGE